MGSWKGRGNQYIQLISHLKSGQEPNSDLRGGRRECYHFNIAFDCYKSQAWGQVHGANFKYFAKLQVQVKVQVFICPSCSVSQSIALFNYS